MPDVIKIMENVVAYTPNAKENAMVSRSFFGSLDLNGLTHIWFTGVVVSH